MASARAVETGDGDQRRPDQVAARHAGIQPERHRIEAVVGIREHLVEVTHADQRLVRQTRREGPVVDQGIVLYVDGLPVVVGKVGPNGRRLCSLAYEPAKREPVVFVEVVIELDQPVVAESVFGVGVEIVVGAGTRQPAAGPDGSKRGGRDGVLRYPVLLYHLVGRLLIADRGSVDCAWLPIRNFCPS